MKFNGFEHHLLRVGLERVCAQMKEDIDKIESEGKRPLMTKGYVDMVQKEAQDKLDSFTSKKALKDAKTGKR